MRVMYLDYPPLPAFLALLYCRWVLFEISICILFLLASNVILFPHFFPILYFSIAAIVYFLSLLSVGYNWDFLIFHVHPCEAGQEKVISPSLSKPPDDYPLSRSAYVYIHAIIPSVLSCCWSVTSLCAGVSLFLCPNDLAMRICMCM